MITPAEADLYAGLDFRQRAELDRRCDWQPPTDDAAERHGRWRGAIKVLMAEAMRTLPPGRESALVLTALDEALMWGNAAIARPNTAGIGTAAP
jgi:hypothetical protein